MGVALKFPTLRLGTNGVFLYIKQKIRPKGQGSREVYTMQSKNILYIVTGLLVLLILATVVYFTFLKDADNFKNNTLESDLDSILPKFTQRKEEAEDKKPQPPLLDDEDEEQIEPEFPILSPTESEEQNLGSSISQPNQETDLGESGTDLEPQPEADEPLAQKEYIVSITSEGFVPQIITVNLGDTITWINNDTELHWPASDPNPTHTGLLGLDPLSDLFPNENFSFTFTKVGVFTYHDHTQAIEGDELTSTGGIRVLAVP